MENRWGKVICFPMFGRIENSPSEALRMKLLDRYIECFHIRTNFRHKRFSGVASTIIDSFVLVAVWEEAFEEHHQ